MRLLLDTHAFLWFIGGDSRLSSHARREIESPANERLLSVASLWEMAIKASLGKLKLALPMPQLVNEHAVGNGIEILPIKPEHLDRLTSLPFHHRDPFDRLIIAQSLAEDVPVVSSDSELGAYEISVVWKKD